MGVWPGVWGCEGVEVHPCRELGQLVVEEVEKRGGKAFICGTPVVSDGETMVRRRAGGLTPNPSPPTPSPSTRAHWGCATPSFRVTGSQTVWRSCTRPMLP